METPLVPQNTSYHNNHLINLLFVSQHNRYQPLVVVVVRGHGDGGGGGYIVVETSPTRVAAVEDTPRICPLVELEDDGVTTHLLHTLTTL